MATTTRTVTYEEWLNMPVLEDAIEEVVNGEIRITPPSKWKHAIVVGNLSDALNAQVDRKAQGQLSPKLFSDVAVDVSPIWPD